MRQKYFISREDVNNELKIREYANIQKAPKNVAFTMRNKETFSFLCEETYEGSRIVSSIHKGRDALVAMIRTRNMFPIRSHAIKIAESVMELYDADGDRSVELYFDDVDLFEKKPLLARG